MNEMISRRTFLKVAGLGTVSIAAFGLTGCGGGSGSSSSTGKTYKVLTDNDMKQLRIELGIGEDVTFDKFTPEQKEKMKKVVPYSNDVYFPLMGAVENFDESTESNTGLSMVTLAFEVMNDSAQQPVQFERSYQNFQKVFNELSAKIMAGQISLKDAIAEANKNYGSKQFASNDAQFITSYGTVDGNPGTATAIPPKQGGVIEAVMLVKQGWEKLNVSFTPNFASGKTFRFEVSRADLIKGDEEE